MPPECVTSSSRRWVVGLGKICFHPAPFFFSLYENSRWQMIVEAQVVVSNKTKYFHFITPWGHIRAKVSWETGVLEISIMHSFRLASQKNETCETLTENGESFVRRTAELFWIFFGLFVKNSWDEMCFWVGRSSVIVDLWTVRGLEPENVVSDRWKLVKVLEKILRKDGRLIAPMLTSFILMKEKVTAAATRSLLMQPVSRQTHRHLVA